MATITTCDVCRRTIPHRGSAHHSYAGVYRKTEAPTAWAGNYPNAMVASNMVASYSPVFEKRMECCEECDKKVNEAITQTIQSLVRGPGY